VGEEKERRPRQKLPFEARRRVLAAAVASRCTRVRQALLEAAFAKRLGSRAAPKPAGPCTLACAAHNSRCPGMTDGRGDGEQTQAQRATRHRATRSMPARAARAFSTASPHFTRFRGRRAAPRNSLRRERPMRPQPLF
jgi:hypothetical protein